MWLGLFTLRCSICVVVSGEPGGGSLDEDHDLVVPGGAVWEWFGSCVRLDHTVSIGRSAADAGATGRRRCPSERPLAPRVVVERVAQVGGHPVALVELHEDGTHGVRYLRQPFRREPVFGVTSVNYDFPGLLARAEAPR